MKSSPIVTVILWFALSLKADTLRIGTFTLPYRFEDGNLSDIVRHVATNEVQAFCTPITGFRKPYHDKDGNVCVQHVNTPDSFYERSATFLDGIKFYIENGQTNCIIKSLLTDAAKAIEGELPMRTNLAHSARQFLDSIQDGSITNRPPAELRLRTRVYKGGVLSVVDAAECPDAMVRQNFVDMREHAVFFPVCILDSTYKPSGTNNYFCIKVGYDLPNMPDYARSIAAFPLVYADGYWCLCLE